jgi:hypothetical protein
MSGLHLPRSWFAAVLLAFAGIVPALADGATPAEDETQRQLDALNDRVVAALNAGDIDALLKESASGVIFTAMTGRVAYGTGGVHDYFNAMRVGDLHVLDEYRIALIPDGPARVYGGDNAVVTGDAKAHYKFAAGMVLDVHGRWTTDLIRADGRWLLASVHYSADMFDNPLLNAAQRLIWIVGAGAGLIGLTVGFLAGRWWRPATA